MATVNQEMPKQYVYKWINSPVGKLKLIATDDALAGVLWETERTGRVRVNTENEDTAHPVLVETERQLEEYLRGRRQHTWEVCQDAAYELIEFPEPEQDPELSARIVAAAKRVCMCFEQQMLADDPRKLPRTSRRILARVMGEAGL